MCGRVSVHFRGHLNCIALHCGGAFGCGVGGFGFGFGFGWIVSYNLRYFHPCVSSTGLFIICNPAKAAHHPQPCPRCNCGTLLIQPAPRLAGAFSYGFWGGGFRTGERSSTISRRIP